MPKLPKTAALTALLPESLIAFGSALKATADGKIVGHLVQFGDAKTADLEGEYFTKDTDFGIDLSGDAVKLPLYYSHGFNPRIGKRRVGFAMVKADDVGIFMEAELDKAERYRAAVLALAESGKLGASSGAVSHLVVKSADDGGKSARITQWPLGEASLTVQPCDPRNLLTMKEFVRGEIFSSEPLFAENISSDMTHAGAVVSPADSATVDPIDMSRIGAETLYRLTAKWVEGVKSLLCSAGDLSEDESQSASGAIWGEYAQKSAAVLIAILSGMGDEEPAEAAKTLSSLFLSPEEIDSGALGALPAGVPLSRQADTALAAVDALALRAKSVASLRVKEGRTLSAATRAKLGDIADRLAAAHGDMKAILDSSDTAPAPPSVEIVGKSAEDTPALHAADDESIRQAMAEHLRRQVARLGVTL